MRLLKILSVICAVAAAVLFGVTFYLDVRDADDVPPQISMDQQQIELPVEATEEEILQGVTATDAEDGDVTDSLLVETLSPFVAEGERIATIVAFDEENHVTKATRTVRYTNYEKTKFSLSTPLSFAVGSKSTALTAAMQAWDCLDGDVTRRITCVTVSGSGLSMDVIGEYPVTFSVSNSAGDVEKFTATVEIYDDTAVRQASLSLTDAMVYLPRGEAFDPTAYIESVTIGESTFVPFQGTLISTSVVDKMQNSAESSDGAEAEIAQDNQLSWDSIQIDNPVDVQTPGWYEVVYRVTERNDKARNIRLLVRVED